VSAPGQRLDVVDLTEYVPRYLPATALSAMVAERIWRQYPSQVDVDFPSPKTGGRWRLTALGWVGHIPLDDGPVLRLGPKVPVTSLFGMLEYAYDLPSLRFLGGLTHLHSLEDVFSELALVLARRVIDRARKGLYRAYVEQEEDLTALRGRVLAERAARTPWRERLPCRYEEHVADLQDNQILLWTLGCILRSDACASRVRPEVRRAYRALAGAVTSPPLGWEACVGRHYHRLNADYAPLHALCRFFLEGTGPTHTEGERASLPFLLDMAQLFERFVAAWLRRHAPPSLDVRVQEKVVVGTTGRLDLHIDLGIYDRRTGEALAVLDTKYKAPAGPDNADVYQVVAYANATGASQAVLIYPTVLDAPFDGFVGDVRVRTLVFDTGGELAMSGGQLLAQLLTASGEMRAA
jgi:5-methylcytosine-specific restriction enzyme subunit McrC